MVLLVVSKLYHRDGAQHRFRTLRPGTVLRPIVMFLWWDYGIGKDSVQCRVLGHVPQLLWTSSSDIHDIAHGYAYPEKGEDSLKNGGTCHCLEV